MLTETRVNPWFAIQTKVRKEHFVSWSLRNKGYEEFLPLCKFIDPSKSSVDEHPLFPGYLFCRLDPSIPARIITTPGVLRILGVGASPSPVDDRELANIRTIIKAGLPTERHDFLSAGERILVIRGPLKGLIGILVRIWNTRRVVVSLTLLQRSVAVEINQSDITYLTSDPTKPYASEYFTTTQQIAEREWRD